MNAITEPALPLPRHRPRDWGFALLVLLATAGLNFMMGVPGADDVMLNYQSTSFHDALVLRDLLGLKRAPEFEAWLQRVGVTGADGRLLPASAQLPLSQRLWTLPEPA